jgi:hypothetical protein
MTFVSPPSERSKCWGESGGAGRGLISIPLTGPMRKIFVERVTRIERYGE